MYEYGQTDVGEINSGKLTFHQGATCQREALPNSGLTCLSKLEPAELSGCFSGLRAEYEKVKGENLRLDMSRGKPCPQQLDLALGMLACVDKDHYKSPTGVDCRNYGGVDGLPEVKELFAPILGVRPEEIIIGGNSSLNMMHDTIARAMLFGVVDGEVPWGRLPVVKFLCPSPGYDRHFALCEFFGIQMITVEMTERGPDMDEVEKLVAADETIKGIWCVPRYSNPTGITYSAETVERLARMRTKAPDFRIFWDNAYVVHHLTSAPEPLKNILEACAEAGHPERVFIFTSTSKISFSGAGLAMLAASARNIARIRKELAFQTIGPDKINQLRHLLFFRDPAGIEAHMKKHAAIIAPKFELVLEMLRTELAGVATWNEPKGGYFINFNTMEGCAKRVVELAAEAGVILTPAGATYPYGKDPLDRNIRLAPTFPDLPELKRAMEVFVLCVKLATVEKLLKTRS